MGIPFTVSFSMFVSPCFTLCLLVCKDLNFSMNISDRKDKTPFKSSVSLFPRQQESTFVRVTTCITTHEKEVSVRTDYVRHQT